jgi:hypothetical protein
MNNHALVESKTLVAVLVRGSQMGTIPFSPFPCLDHLKRASPFGGALGERALPAACRRRLVGTAGRDRW